MTPLALSHYVIRYCRHNDSQGERLLLDSRVLDAPRAYNLIFVTLPWLCTKNPVSTLTHRSIRPFRSHYEGFFATKEACLYSKNSYKGPTFVAKPSSPDESAFLSWF